MGSRIFRSACAMNRTAGALSDTAAVAAAPARMCRRLMRFMLALSLPAATHQPRGIRPGQSLNVPPLDIGWLGISYRVTIADHRTLGKTRRPAPGDGSPLPSAPV